MRSAVFSRIIATLIERAESERIMLYAVCDATGDSIANSAVQMMMGQLLMNKKLTMDSGEYG